VINAAQSFFVLNCFQNMNRLVERQFYKSKLETHLGRDKRKSRPSLAHAHNFNMSTNVRVFSNTFCTVT
jgi:hypothetical protein